MLTVSSSTHSMPTISRPTLGMLTISSTTLRRPVESRPTVRPRGVDGRSIIIREG